jgi:hypothetical protein
MESVEEAKGSTVFSRRMTPMAIPLQNRLISLIVWHVQPFLIATNGVRT